MKSNTNKTLLWLIPAVLIFAAGFIVGALFDLDISKAVYNPTFSFAITLEATCKYPLYIMPIIFFVLLATEKKLSMLFRLVAGALSAGILAYMMYESYEELTLRGWFENPALLSSAICLAICLLVLYGITWRFLLTANQDTRNKMAFLGFWGTVLCCFFFLFIGGGKIIWRRTRFDDMYMLGSFDAFTPWYRPFGNGGSSFPSGHTAAACGIFGLIILCDLYSQLNKYRKGIYVACFAFVIISGASRVLIGRHFLSDTLAAAALMLISFYIIRHNKFYRQGLKNTLSN